MEKLLSPGVALEISTDPLTASSSEGTVPLLFIATAQDKFISPVSSKIASGTTKENAGKLQIVTSQREVLEKFGTPIFQEHNGTIVQGDELNEYGLHALYSYMGVANRALVLRADLDIAQLAPTGVEPSGKVKNGTMWLDTKDTQLTAYVAKKENPQTFTDWQLKPVMFVTAEEIDEVDTSSLNVDDLVARYRPSNGQLLIYIFTATGLVQVETRHEPTNKMPKDGKIWLQRGFTQSGASFFGSHFVLKRYASLSDIWKDVPVFAGNNFYEVESQAGAMSNKYIAAVFDDDSYSFSFYINAGKNNVESESVGVVKKAEGDEGGDVHVIADAEGFLTIKYLNKRVKTKIVTNTGIVGAYNIVTALNNENELINDGFKFTYDDDAVKITNTNGYSFEVSQTGFECFPKADVAKLSADGVLNYAPVNLDKFNVSNDEPRDIAPEGTLWFDLDPSDSTDVTLYEADVDEESWSLVLEKDKYVQLDEPAADRKYWIRPLSQGIDGFEFFRNVDDEWVKLDVTDQTTTNGIIFEDFTAAPPAAELYMDGMLAVDMANTEGVVREMKDGKWTIASGVDLQGAGIFGRRAQRKMIVEAIAEQIMSNEEVRSDSVYYNLIAAPGYVELLDEMVTLNVDIKELAFILADTPPRMKPDSQSVNNWAKNTDMAPSNGDVGRTTAYDYAAMYNQWNLSTNLDGSEVVVPPSTVALRTYAYSDSVSYLWFPPAGTQRGVVTNATSTGYINEEGEFVPVAFTQGQRDTMYINNINPILMRPARGLIVYGDKTLSPNGDATPLSRVNVARLVCYIKREIDRMSEIFLFRLNTPSTRQEFAGMVNNFLAELVQLDGLEDFIVVCDESNNTRERINRNEMWLDIAIVPTKSVNFIYVPIRVKNSMSAA